MPYDLIVHSVNQLDFRGTLYLGCFYQMVGWPTGLVVCACDFCAERFGFQS